MNRDILPCPFDGKQPILKSDSGSWGYYSGKWYIVCECGARSRKFDDEAWSEKKGTYSIRDEAIESAKNWWNRRVK